MKEWDFKTNGVIERKLPSFGSRWHSDKEAVFDFNERRYMKRWMYTKKQRRAFHRCISGLLRAKGRLERIRFMTLTSSPQSNKEKLNYHFNLLVKQIEYTFGFKMQYWKVKTNEGYGVLHILQIDTTIGKAAGVDDAVGYLEMNISIQNSNTGTINLFSNEETINLVWIFRCT